MVALTAGLLAPAAAPATGARAKAIRVEVPTPSAGDVTIEDITTTVPSHVARFPELQLFAPNDRSLPPGVIALTATRTHRAKRSTTFRTIVLVLDRRTTGTAARAADDEPLAGFGRLLIDGEEPRTGSPGGYVGVSLAFTTLVPAATDLWSEQESHRLAVPIVVGVQPNANAGNTDVRACWALSDTIQLGSTGKPAPGLTFRFFDGPGALPWNQDGIGSVFVHFASDCRAGAGGLNTALTPVIHDLGLSDGQLGEPENPLVPIGKAEAQDIIFGAELNDDPELAEEAEDDYVLWQEIEELFSGPATDSLLAPAPARRAHAAGTRSGAVPANGQVTKVEVRGYYLGGCHAAEEVCEKNLHFQDLRPLPNGELEVIGTTQAFTLPKQPGTYTFEPTNFFVQKGDYVGLATVGGKFEVLVKAPGATTNVFVKDKGDDNGDHVTGTKKTGEELNMRVTLQPSE
jgi:hypothetical protein